MSSDHMSCMTSRGSGMTSSECVHSSPTHQFYRMTTVDIDFEPSNLTDLSGSETTDDSDGAEKICIKRRGSRLQAGHVTDTDSSVDGEEMSGKRQGSRLLKQSVCHSSSDDVTETLVCNGLNGNDWSPSNNVKQFHDKTTRHRTHKRMTSQTDRIIVKDGLYRRPVDSLSADMLALKCVGSNIKDRKVRSRSDQSLNYIGGIDVVTQRCAMVNQKDVPCRSGHTSCTQGYGHGRQHTTALQQQQQQQYSNDVCCPLEQTTDTDEPTLSSSLGRESLLDQAWDTYQDSPYSFSCDDTEEEKLDASALIHTDWPHGQDTDTSSLTQTSRCRRQSNWSDCDTSDAEDLENVITQSRRALSFTNRAMFTNTQQFAEELETCRTNIDCLNEVLNAMNSGKFSAWDIKPIQEQLCQWSELQMLITAKQQLTCKTTVSTPGDITSQSTEDSTELFSDVIRRPRTISGTSCNATLVDETRQSDVTADLDALDNTLLCKSHDSDDDDDDGVGDVENISEDAGIRHRNSTKIATTDDIESLHRRTRRRSTGYRLYANLSSTRGVLPAVLLMLITLAAICWINYSFTTTNWLTATRGLSINPRLQYVMGPPPT